MNDSKTEKNKAGKAPAQSGTAKDSPIRKDIASGAAISPALQWGLVIGALVATLVIVYVLQHVLGLGTATTLGIGVLALVILVFAALFIMTEVRKSRIAADANATCKPILERYKDTGNVSRLLDDYSKWAEGTHDQKLVLDFTQATIDALVEGGHEKQARRQLRILKGLISADPRQQEAFENYERQCESKLRAAKKNARKARR